MHDLLRVYAAETAESHLSTPDRRRALGRLLAYYQGTTTSAIDLMFPIHRNVRQEGGGEQSPVVVAGPEIADARSGAAWLAAERVNLVRACGFAASNGWPHEAVALVRVL